MTENMNVEKISKALASIASGCAVMTAKNGSDSMGMLASWVQQAAFEPPMVSVSVKKGRPIEPIANGSKRFTLNILGEKGTPLMRHFGGGFSPGEDAFSGIESKESDYGVVLGDAIAHLGCELVSVIDAGDHNLYLGKVVDAGSEGAKPYVHIRKSGMSY